MIAVCLGPRVREELAAIESRGFLIVPIEHDRSFEQGESTTALIPVQDRLLPDLMRELEDRFAAVAAPVNPLLPVAHPGEYHSPDPVGWIDGGASVFVLRLTQFERVT